MASVQTPDTRAAEDGHDEQGQLGRAAERQQQEGPDEDDWRPRGGIEHTGNLMLLSPRSIRKISDDHKAFALGRQTQAGIQAYELPTFRSMLADKQRGCQLQ
ncbi:MAG: hypothetical protein U0932_05000 [Thiobacillus sp.]|nr:hypothetical protein [Thiobacillus sp.]